METQRFLRIHEYQKMNNEQPKLDTPLKIKDIEEIAKAFQKAKDEMPEGESLIPPGDHWQDNLSVDYYLGQLTGINLAMRGLDQMVHNPESSVLTLLNELNLVSGQLCEKVLARNSKILTVEK